jgi:O-antigen/teichoic acid export membrane protein
LCEDPTLIVVPADSKYKTMKELLDDAKANPGKISGAGSSGLSVDAIAFYTMVDLSGAVLGGLVTLVLAFKGYGVWALVAGTFTSQTWKTLGLNIVARIRIRPSLSFGGMKEYLVFGGHFSASTLLWFFFTQADVFIAGRWLGKEALGYYSVAMHLASLFNQRLAGVINQVAFPAFAHIQNDPKQVGDKVQLGARILSFFSFPCLWGISAVAPEIVMVILGPKWEQATLPLAILSLIMPLRVLGNFMPNALQGIGRTDVVLKNSAIACLIMPTAYLIGVNWGLIGLSYAWLFGAPLLFLDNTARSVRALGISLIDIFKCLWPGVVAGAIMYVTIIVARSLLFSGVISPASLLTLVVVGAAAYMVASLLLNRAGSREVLGLLKGMATFKKKAEPQ